MRFLLVFHSDRTAEWRCFDTAMLPETLPGAAAIPAALMAAPDLALRWLLGRFGFGPFRAGEAAGQIEVYPLDPAAPLVACIGDYLGPWLEMFREEQPLIGSIALERVTGGAISDVLARARAPLSAQDEACQKTLDLLRDQQSSAGDTRQRTPAVRDETAAMPVDT